MKGKIRPEFPACLVLTLGIAAAFSALPGFDFIQLDDMLYVVDNPHVRGLSWNHITWAFTTLHAGFWIPLTWLSFMVDHALFGHSSGGYHLTNLFLHTASTWFLFLFLLRTTKKPWLSLMVAFFFGVHPLQVESVAWITERKDVLSAFFFMLMLLAYAKYTKKPNPLRYGLVFLALLAGLMAKPMLVTAPFALLLFDYWPLGRFGKTDNGPAGAPPQNGLKGAGRLVVEKIPLFALVAFFSVLTFMAQKKTGAIMPVDALSFDVRLANAFFSYARYLENIFFPLSLGVVYPHPGAALQVWQIVFSFGLILLICLAAVLFRKGREWLFLGWFFFLGTLFPVIGLSQSGPQAMADRFAYIPVIGIWVVFVWGAYGLTKKIPAGRIILAIVFCVICLALVAQTRRQAGFWENSESLFEHTLSLTSGNWLVHSSYASYLMDQGKPEKALSHYREVIRLRPHRAMHWVFLGDIFKKLGRNDDAGLAYERAVLLEPGYAYGHVSLGAALVEKGHSAQGIAAYERALALDPGLADAWNNLGSAYSGLGQKEKAVEHFQKALSLNPYSAYIHFNLGTVLDELGRSREAAGHFIQALERKPDLPGANLRLANMLADRGRFEQAVSHFQKALSLSPDYQPAKDNLSIAKDLSAQEKASP